MRTFRILESLEKIRKRFAARGKRPLFEAHWTLGIWKTSNIPSADHFPPSNLISPFPWPSSILLTFLSRWWIHSESFSIVKQGIFTFYENTLSMSCNFCFPFSRDFFQRLKFIYFWEILSNLCILTFFAGVVSLQFKILLIESIR